MVTYTTEELQDFLHCGVCKLIQLRKAGLLTGVKLGKGYIYTKEEIDKFLREQKNGA